MITIDEARDIYMGFYDFVTRSDKWSKTPFMQTTLTMASDTMDMMDRKILTEEEQDGVDSMCDCLLTLMSCNGVDIKPYLIGHDIEKEFSALHISQGKEKELGTALNGMELFFKGELKKKDLDKMTDEEIGMLYNLLKNDLDDEDE